MVHRDLKPSNVLIAEGGPRVIDFGISRAVESTALTQAGLAKDPSQRPAAAGLLADNIITVSDVWGKFPINQVIRARWWRVPCDEVPRSAGHEAQLQWLYDWWERIDTWISQNRPGGAAAPEVAALPEDETAEPVGELNAPRVRRYYKSGVCYLAGG